jgi:hypothetical protein
MVGSQNVPPSAPKNRKNSGGPGGALRVSRVLADFGTGFPRRLESFAFMHEVAYGTATTCARVVCGQRVHRRRLGHHWIEPFLGHGIAAEMAESALDKMTGMIRLERCIATGSSRLASATGAKASATAAPITAAGLPAADRRQPGCHTESTTSFAIKREGAALSPPGQTSDSMWNSW